MVVESDQQEEWRVFVGIRNPDADSLTKDFKPIQPRNTFNTAEEAAIAAQTEYRKIDDPSVWVISIGPQDDVVWHNRPVVIVATSEQEKTDRCRADAIRSLNLDRSINRLQLARRLRELAADIELAACSEQGFQRGLSFGPSANSALTKSTATDKPKGRIVEYPVYNPVGQFFSTCLSFLCGKQSRGWNWKPLTRFVSDKSPIVMTAVSGDDKAKPRTNWWSSFYQTNFGWKLAVLLKPKYWGQEYHVGFNKVENGVEKTEVCELLLEGTVACLLGPELTSFFAVVYDGDGIKFAELEIKGIVKKSKIPNSVPLI